MVISDSAQLCYQWCHRCCATRQRTATGISCPCHRRLEALAQSFPSTTFFLLTSSSDWMKKLCFFIFLVIAITLAGLVF